MRTSFMESRIQFSVQKTAPGSNDDPDSGYQLDDREAESIGFLAANGFLADEEIVALREKVTEAQARIDTDSERSTQPGVCEPYGGDRCAVKVGAALEAAITSSQC